MMPVVTLTAEQMLSRWKLSRYFEPLRSDCLITRTDGIDLDRLLMQEIDAWYITQLHSLPIEHLPLTDITARLSPIRTDDGAAMVALPDDVLRIASVMVDGWLRPPQIITDMSTPMAMAQSSPMARGGCAAPVVVVTQRRMMLYTPPPGDISLSSVSAVVLPHDNTYYLTPTLLSDITLNNNERHSELGF